MNDTNGAMGIEAKDVIADVCIAGPVTEPAPVPELPVSGWTPTYDFVYFRATKAEQATANGVLLPGEENMRNAVVIAVGPGRMLPSGAMRVPPCKRGDYIRINAVNGQGGPVTEFVDDDGEMTYIVGGEYIVQIRQDVPPTRLGRVIPNAPPEPPRIVAPQPPNIVALIGPDGKPVFAKRSQ